VAETCTGSSAGCPTNGFKSSATVCRSASGVCDLAETCTGSSASCPNDAVKAPDALCRSVAGLCDEAEYCDGTNKTCPANGYASNGTACRAAAGDCDVAEVCTGTSAACPPDASASDGSSCNDGNVCTATDTCVGGVCTGADGALGVSPAAALFNDTIVGNSATPIDVTVSNMTTGTLRITDIGVSPAVFSVTNDTLPIVIPPGGDAVLTVSFDPQNTGDFDGTITLTTDQTGCQTFDVPVTGSAYTVGVDVAPTTWDFGDVGVGEPAVTHTFTLTNTGTHDVEVTSVELDDTVNFTLPTTWTSGVINPDGTLEFDVLSHPTTEGAKTATITINHDIAGTPPLTVSVSANGVCVGSDCNPGDADAGPTPTDDAGSSNPGNDAGVDTGPGGDNGSALGCGCNGSGDSGAPLAVLLVLAAVAVALRRKSCRTQS